MSHKIEKDLQICRDYLKTHTFLEYIKWMFDNLYENIDAIEQRSKELERSIKYLKEQFSVYQIPLKRD